MAKKLDIEKITYKKLQKSKKLKKDDLINLIRKSEDVLRKRFSSIENAGYELTQEQQTFKERRRNRQYLTKMSEEDLRDYAGAVKRQIERKSSTLTGVREITVHRLEGLSLEDAFEGEVRRAKGSDDYRVGNTVISQDELKLFWEALRKSNEDNELQNVKDGSETGFNRIKQLFFFEGMRDPDEIAKKIKEIAEEGKTELKNIKEEEEEGLEDVKIRSKGRKRFHS